VLRFSNTMGAPGVTAHVWEVSRIITLLRIAVCSRHLRAWDRPRVNTLVYAAGLCIQEDGTLQQCSLVVNYCQLNISHVVEYVASWVQ